MTILSWTSTKRSLRHKCSIEAAKVLRVPHLFRQPMSAKIERIEGTLFRATINGFDIVTGRANENSPPAGMFAGQVLFAALGLCTGTRVVEQMEKRGWPVGAVRVDVKPKVSKDMNRATEIMMNVEIEANLTEEQRKEILMEAGRCFVSNTIKNSPEVKISLKLV